MVVVVVTIIELPVPNKVPVPFGPVYQFITEPVPAVPPAAVSSVLETAGTVIAKVDAVDGIFFGTVDTGDIRITTDTITSNNLFVGSTTAPLNALQFHSDFFTYRTVTDPANGKFFTMTQSRGTLASPTAIQAGDELGGVLVRAYTNTSVSGIAGVFGFVVDSTASIVSGGGFVKSKAVIAASSDTTQNLSDALVLDSAGLVTSNAFSATNYFKLPVYANDAARSAAIPTPATGMMVFMTAGTSPAVTNKTVVYDSTAWVALL
jgi:hypothetical protein